MTETMENDGLTPIDPQWEMSVEPLPEEQGPEGEHEVAWRVPNRKMLRDSRRRYQKIKRQRSRIRRGKWCYESHVNEPKNLPRATAAPNTSGQ